MIQTDRLYSTDDLYTIRQGDSEPLREYAARFNHEHKQYSRCPETDDRAPFGAFKRMPSAFIGPTTSTSQPSASTYDRFPPHQTTNQAPYRTTPTVPAPYTTGDK
ncbi:unnamed protein product [Prunus brigantina]